MWDNEGEKRGAIDECGCRLCCARRCVATRGSRWGGVCLVLAFRTLKSWVREGQDGILGCGFGAIAYLEIGFVI